MDDEFRIPLGRYAAALDLASTSSGHAKSTYEAKASQFVGDLRAVVAKSTWRDAFQITCRGRSKTIIEWAKGKSVREISGIGADERINVSDLVNTLAGICLSPCFEDRAPDYPVLLGFSSPRALRSKPPRTPSGPSPARLALGRRQPCSMRWNCSMVTASSRNNHDMPGHILDLLARKGQGQVLNRSELIQDDQGVEYMDKDRQRLEPVWAAVVLAALVYSGHVVSCRSRQKVRRDQSWLPDRDARGRAGAVSSTSSAPRTGNLPALGAVFELLGLIPGMAHSVTQGNQDAVKSLQTAIGSKVEDLVLAQQQLRRGLLLWGQEPALRERGARAP